MLFDNENRNNNNNKGARNDKFALSHLLLLAAICCPSFTPHPSPFLLTEHLSCALSLSHCLCLICIAYSPALRCQTIFIAYFLARTPKIAAFSRTFLLYRSLYHSVWCLIIYIAYFSALAAKITASPNLRSINYAVYFSVLCLSISLCLCLPQPLGVPRLLRRFYYYYL